MLKSTRTGILRMRWDFIDPSNQEEAKAREGVVAAIDRWWSAFVAHADRLCGAFARSDDFDVAGFTIEHLRAINQHLMWEYGPAIAKKGHRLVITPEGNHELHPLIRELLRRAPQLPDWEFYPARLPETWEIASRVAEQIARFAARGVHAQVSLGRFRRIDLKFHIDNAKGNESAAQNYMFRAIEQLLGEEILDHWIGSIELAPPVSMLSRLVRRRAAGFIPIENIKSTVDALINASCEQLPHPPARVLAQSDPDEKVMWSAMERTPSAPTAENDYPGRTDLGILITCEPDISEAGQIDPLFYSGRFSRTGEMFAYVKFDRSSDKHGSPLIDSADKRSMLERAIGATLVEHGLGCAYGGGTGLRYGYVDVALTDVRRALPILRELLQRLRLSRRSWLMFFDAELQNEWMGIYEDGPAPPVRLQDNDVS